MSCQWTAIRLRRGLARTLFLLAFVSFQSLADVTSLVVDPQSPTTVYAGTSEGGVLKSTDGGASWTRAGLMHTPVITLAIDPGAPSLLYALTWNGLLKSVNGGDTWSPTLMGGSGSDWTMHFWSVNTLALARRTDPALPATVYAGVSHYAYAGGEAGYEYWWGVVLASTDSGEAWGDFLGDLSGPWSAAPAAMAAAAQTDTTPATLYTSGEGYQVCWIRDGRLTGCGGIGQSPGVPNVLAVDPHNPHVVYAGMNGAGVYKTTDAAVTWSGGGSGNVRALVFDAVTPGTLYAVIYDQGVVKSTDGGATWTAVNAGLEPGVSALAIDPLTPAILYAATASGVFKSTDAGASWNPTAPMQRLQSLSVPAGLIGGTAGTGTVTLNAPAPGGGKVVALSSSNPALASVPATVTVAAGATSASFPISTVAVAETAVHVIYAATLDGLVTSASLSVGPAIEDMVPWTYGLVGGMTVSVTVMFGVVPAGGAVVALTSSDPAVAAVPATVTAPAGAKTASFTVTTTAVSVETMVRITATYAGETRSTLLTVLPQAVYGLSLNPASLLAGSRSSATVTLFVPAPAGGTVVTLSSSNTSVATVPASVTVPAGATSASFTVSTNSVLPPGRVRINVHISASVGSTSAIRALQVALRTSTPLRRRADFNGDARSDVLWRNASSGENYLYPMSSTTILPGEGYLRTVPDPDWRIAGVGDFDGDGRADILWRNRATGENYIYLMSGTEIAGEGYLRTVPDQNWQIAGVGDFDGDGRDDILWRNAATGENYIFLMNALSVVSEGYLRTVADLAWEIRGVGDFDGDGKADILWRNAATGENYVYFMNGPISILGEGYLRTVTDLDWKVASVGDFDGDGRTDIAWRNSSSGENYVYLMQGTNIVGEGYLRSVPDLAWQIVASGDYDGDGRSDLLWRNSSTGENYLYPMDGTAIQPTEGYVRTVPTGSWNIASP